MGEGGSIESEKQYQHGTRWPSESSAVHVMEEPIWAQPIFDQAMAMEGAPPEGLRAFVEADAPLPAPPEDLLENGFGWRLSIDAAFPVTTGPADEKGRLESQHAERLSDVQDEVDGQWARMQACFERKESLKGQVTGWNKGGLLVQLGNLQGFIPASQLIRFPRHLDTAARDEFLAQQVGKELELAIIELERERNRLVLSERACIWGGRQGQELLEILKSGDIVEGIVSNLCNFGAFVDLGGFDGLVHISEISWRRVGHPQDVLSIGQRVRVRVLSVDREHGRIALSLRRLATDPWEDVEQRYHVGQIVRGVITNVVNFGAFARIEDGLEGLIHISELAEGNFSHPRNVVQEGQEVNVCILNIDGAKRRLGLSLRQAPQRPAAAD